MKKKTRKKWLFKRSHSYPLYSFRGVVIRERHLIDRGFRRKGNRRDPEDIGLLKEGEVILPSFSFNPKSRYPDEFKGRIPIGRIYKIIRHSQSKVLDPRISRKVSQIMNARNYIRFGVFFIGLSVILPFMIQRAYVLSIFLLFFGIINFLYGIRGFNSHNMEPFRLRDTFLIYGGSLMIIIGVIFILYASEAFLICYGYVICPVSPLMAIGIGIGLIIFAIIFIRNGINSIKLKSLIALLPKSKFLS